MSKQQIWVSIIKSLIIGIFILGGSWIIGKSVGSNDELRENMYYIGNSMNSGVKDVRVYDSNQPRYQMISNGEEIIILDTITGEYYSKVDSGSDWIKTENPFSNE